MKQELGDGPPNTSFVLGTRLLRPLLALLAIAAGLVALLVDATPAAAAVKATLHVGIGKEVTVTAPPIFGQGYGPARAAPGMPTPEKCLDDPLVSTYCDLYEVELDVPPERFTPQGSGLTMVSVLTFDPIATGPEAPATGYPSAHVMVERIYQTPRVKDPESGQDTFNASTGTFDPPPQQIAAGNVNTTHFQITVANYVGVTPAGYSLAVKLIDNDVPLIDLSIEEPIPEIAETPDAPISVTGPPRIVTREIGASAPITTDAPLASVGPAPSSPIQPTLLLPGVGAPDLGFGTIGGSSLPDSELAAAISGRNPLKIPAPGKADPVTLLLWLVLGPVLASGLFFGLLMRRRRDDPLA